MQAAAINSLSAYAAEADAFVIVAPELVHSDTAKLCDQHTYLRRMWCRAENLCHYLVEGSENMWMATSPDDCSRAAARTCNKRCQQPCSGSNPQLALPAIPSPSRESFVSHDGQVRR
jgi:hypothetical protein